ncbi:MULTISPECIES: hypothetical protein [Enterobacteriaceae]|uniref:hypothetical protein n=1 Tax=Enterobacteriaceae TaxID=543 RepID=UPI000272B076|nr:hypothetical protein [Enterobacter sp. Ag1]EJF31711.1 hypothetical protein A936_08963 [Enterobacter sp. Ag1]
MSNQTTNTYNLLVFGSEGNKPLISLVSQTPFGPISRGDSINVQDLRGDDRESICTTSGDYANVTNVQHRITQGPGGDIQHITKIVLDSSNQAFE